MRPFAQCRRALQLVAPPPRRREADLAPGRFGKLRQAADLGQQIEDRLFVGGKLSTVTVNLAGQLVDGGRELGIGRQRGAHAHEGANDQNADLDRATGTQHIGGHEAAVLSEGKRQACRVSVLLGTSRNLREVRIATCAAQTCCSLQQVPSFPLRGRELKHEVGGKPIPVAAHLLIQAICRHAIQPCQIRIQHHSLAADHVDRAFNCIKFRKLRHLSEFPLARERSAPAYLLRIN
jgi:hypothetical protein